MLLIRSLNSADGAGGRRLKHRSLRQTRLLSWEPSRRGACSRLANRMRSVGAATDSIDLEQRKKKKKRPSAVQLQGCRSQQLFPVCNGPLTQEGTSQCGRARRHKSQASTHQTVATASQMRSGQIPEAPTVSFSAHGSGSPLGSGLSALLLPCVAAVIPQSDWF